MMRAASGTLWRPRPLMLALVVLVCVLYANSLDNEFVFDDDHSIVNNESLRSLTLVPRFFVDPTTFSDDPAMAMYRPVQQASLAFSYALVGLSPWGYHGVSILLHAATSVLVFLLALRTTGVLWASWGGALLFAVHPINSQIVNYASSRSGQLAALGVVAAFLILLRQRPRLWAAALSHLLGLLSKSTALVLLPLVALHQWRRGPCWQRVGLVAATSVAYLVAASASGFLGGSVREFVRPLTVQVMTQAKALAYYVYLIAVPAHLSVAHAFAESLLPSATVLSAAALSLSAVGLALVAWWRRGQGFWILWFYTGLGLTFLMPLNVLASEQRLYLSAAGLAVGAASLTARRAACPTGLVTIGLLLLVVLTWQRNVVWDDDHSLWTSAAAWAPPSDADNVEGMSIYARAFWAKVNLNLGEAYYDDGDTARARQAYVQTVRFDPESPSAWNNLGVLDEEAGQLGRAEIAYRNGLDLRPDWPEARANLGRLLLHMGRPAEAAEQLALAAAQPRPGLLVNLGIAARRVGDLQAADGYFAAALDLAPEHVDAIVNLGGLRQEEGAAASGGRREALWTQARALYAEALRLDAAHPEALLNAGGLEAAAGHGAAAEAYYHRALESAPRLAAVHAGYGRFLLQRGRSREAAEALEQAVALDAWDAEAWVDLGSARVARGELGAAAEALRVACARDSTRVIPFYNLGEVLVHLGEQAFVAGEPVAGAAYWREALACFARVESLEPEFRGTRARAAQLQEQLR